MLASAQIRRGLWLLLALQALLAVIALRPWIAGDSLHNLKLADSLAAGWYGTVTQDGAELDVTRPPGYPMLIALVT